MPSNRDTVEQGIDDKVFQNNDRLVTGQKANEALKLITDNFVNQVDDIIDNLSSTSTNDALSANQGRVLSEGKTNKPLVVSGNLTAANDTNYTNVATATYTDPTPVEGKGFTVVVRNGTATIGGVGYSTAGSVIRRIFHSGAWANYYDSPFNDATSSIQTQLNGKLTSVSGTTNRITITGGDTIDIAPTYVGQTSITTLGTITTGTLSTGAVIGGVTMTLGSDATGDMYYRSSGGVLTRSSIGSRGQIFQVGASSVPQWNSNILDTNGNTLVGLTTVSSAVNFWNVSNAATGNSPILSTPNSGAGTDQVGIGGQIDLGLGTGAGNSGRLIFTTGGISTTGSTVQTRFNLLQVANLNSTNSAILLNQPSNNFSISSTLYNFIQGNTGLFINSPIAATSMVFRINNATFLTGTTSALTLSSGVVMTLAAGTTTSAPLLFTSGTNRTTAAAGSMEYNGTNLFFTRVGTTREGVLTQSAVTTEVLVSDTSVTVNINGTTYKLLARA